MTTPPKAKDPEDQVLESLVTDLVEDQNELEEIKQDALRRIARLELQLGLLRERDRRWTLENK